VTQSINDFRAFSDLTSSAVANFVGISFLAIPLISTLFLLKQAKNYPLSINSKESYGKQ